MKRYVAFVAVSWEAAGGWKDVLAEDDARDDSPARSFDSQEEAITAAKTNASHQRQECVHGGVLARRRPPCRTDCRQWREREGLALPATPASSVILDPRASRLAAVRSPDQTAFFYREIKNYQLLSFCFKRTVLGTVGTRVQANQDSVLFLTVCFNKLPFISLIAC